jgi:hypothetical protein
MNRRREGLIMDAKVIFPNGKDHGLLSNFFFVSHS